VGTPGARHASHGTHVPRWNRCSAWARISTKALGTARVHECCRAGALRGCGAHPRFEADTIGTVCPTWQKPTASPRGQCARETRRMPPGPSHVLPPYVGPSEASNGGEVGQ